MDPRHLFIDQRLTGLCVYCGGPPETKDHVPPKVLLDEPYPDNLPTVPSCATRNGNCSLHEQYVACLVECAVTGTLEPDRTLRPKVKRMLEENPALRLRLEGSRTADASGHLSWKPEADRVRAVVLKLARGHAAYELSLPQLDDPLDVSFAPFVVMTYEQRTLFESGTASGLGFWPEIGSRAFIRAATNWQPPDPQGWLTVQEGRYRYAVEQVGGLHVRIVLSEYLACEVCWE